MKTTTNTATENFAGLAITASLVTGAVKLHLATCSAVRPSKKMYVATTEIDGANYGVPWYIGVRALYYRTDVFSELGLEVPATLAELDDPVAWIARTERLGLAA